MIFDSGTTQLIHETMIQQELERHGPAHLLRTREPFPVANPLQGLRGFAASTVYHLANRIDPMPRGAKPTLPACPECAAT